MHTPLQGQGGPVRENDFDFRSKKEAIDFFCKMIIPAVLQNYNEKHKNIILTDMERQKDERLQLALF